jgi:hypothetical protein
MKKIVLVFSILLIFIFNACQTKNKTDEQLAKQYCGSCHLFPDPSLLDKKSWEKGVLPRMAFRMGMNNMNIISYVPQTDFEAVFSILPQKPMVTEKEWLAITNYFLKRAPDSLTVIKNDAYKKLERFEALPVKLPSNDLPQVTLIKIDSASNKIFVGTRRSKLYKFSNDLIAEDSFLLTSPPSYIRISNESSEISLMGIMDPNDQPAGEMITLSTKDRTAHPFIDSLKRPVFFEKMDLNNDQIEDYLICAFGNYTGYLVAYEGKANGTYIKKVIYGSPGSRKIVPVDFNNDGLKDFIVLFAQGDEHIALFTNKGNFNFDRTVLLRFPPVYGSSYFEIADFNKDGKFDILYTNGDNADFSPIIKPYHGVRIYLNDGDNKFHESWFHFMPGASEAITRDFDNDGDLDIAAISFFPDFKNQPDASFIYFENKNGAFNPYTTPLANLGRWLVMDAEDIDKDGDCDLLLGALAFPSKEAAALFKDWTNQKTSIMVFKNKTIE